MAKKKTTKDLSERNPLEIIADLQVMQATAGWAIMVQIIGKQLIILNEMILNKTSDGREDGPVISDADVDELRHKRGYLIDLRDTPQRYINTLQTEDVQPEDFDPYYKNANDIIKDRKKAQ